MLDFPGLEARHLLRLLMRKELPRTIVLRISKKKSWLESYPVKLALLKHPHVLRESALPLLKHMHLFDLLDIAKTPGALANIASRIARSDPESKSAIAYNH